MPLKASDYFLSDAENAAIFEQQIWPNEFGGCERNLVAVASTAAVMLAPANQVRPVCIILAGQTGVGKSHAAPAFAAALNKITEAGTRLCHLVADSHKPYHPAYAGLVADAAAGRAPAGLASAATGHDARRWLASACAVAAAQKRATLVESASRYPQDVAKMAATFQEAGYRVCLVLLGAHAAQSRLGLLARFLDASNSSPTSLSASIPESEPDSRRRPSLPVRLTPRAIHDESYAGLALLAGMLDSQTGRASGEKVEFLADAVRILRRGNLVAYANDWQHATGTWQTAPADVCRALTIERARRWTSNDDGSDSSSRDVADAPLAREAALFASDVARLRAAHPDRADELNVLAEEYEAVLEASHSEIGKEDEAAYSALDADALVAHLQCSAW
ncbi:hypothetical protein SEPCBS57363_001691 [Sporothrix epigloea]|uniref:Zeta toxin domain-containing protein n=1 Tax=Sporothrix epigloea TaxID=1892477 RepID=A0ABP0DFL6_9PEZI